MKQRRFSVVDIGTNSARFLAVELASDGTWKAVADRREPCRLGEGLSAGGVLGEGPQARAIAAVASFCAAAEEAKAPIVRAVATHAVRKASNRDEFIERLRQATGIDLDAIPPRTEGRLSYRAVAEEARAGRDAKPARLGVIDTGGGSVQLTVGVGEVPVASVSVPLGAVGLTEMFGGPEKSAGERFEEMREHIGSTVAEAIGRLPFMPVTLYGVGGGCTSAGILSRLRGAGLLLPGGPGIPRDAGASIQTLVSDVRDLLRMIRQMTPAERAALPGLSVERSQIIVPGLAVIEALLSRLKPHGMTTMHVGLRDGLVIEAVETVRVRASARRQDRRSILPVAAARLADRCRAEVPHSGHVAMLAVGLHRELLKLAEAGELRKGRWCRRRSAAILHAAALVHDAGIAVSYKGHHKHSEAIVLFNGLAGVKARDVGLVAAIARYHRRARPSRKHDLFGSLDRKDRRLVRMLAGILRVADGMDRSHGQVVSHIHAVIADGELKLLADAEQEPAREIAAALEKSDLLQKVVRRKLSVAWKNRPAASEAAPRAHPSGS